ncbi:hypothetical protein [Zooshikella sp. RANM57]|uniref:hypothetical protein n=1 Tax=Zooshikella sp. RANM57 TaxID=3425863 RepID=UPI003D6F089C
MVKNILKLLLTFSSVATCLYGINTFGNSMWPLIVIGLSGIVFISIFKRSIDKLAIIVCRIMGVVCIGAAVLLLVAGTIGGSFHLSKSNEVILLGLISMGTIGCLFFFVKLEEKFT